MRVYHEGDVPPGGLANEGRNRRRGSEQMCLKYRRPTTNSVLIITKMILVIFRRVSDRNKLINHFKYPGLIQIP
jgi:hypothetical protein